MNDMQPAKASAKAGFLLCYNQKGGDTMDGNPNPMTFVNEPDISKITAALSRILSAKYNADITVTAIPKSKDIRQESSKKGISKGK